MLIDTFTVKNGFVDPGFEFQGKLTQESRFFPIVTWHCKSKDIYLLYFTILDQLKIMKTCEKVCDISW